MNWKQWRKHVVSGVFTLLALGLAPMAAAVDWPQELEGKEGTVVIYQPQVDAIEGNQLKARAAMSIEMKSGGDPIFGAMWMTADIETDRGEDIARISNLRVERATWPDSKDTGEQRFTRFVEDAVADSVMETSLSAITASLAASEKAEESLQELNNEPPKIVFRQELAILLLYDGKPRFGEIENSKYERALNTPLAVVKDGRSYYLTSGHLWYQASDPLGPWRVTQQVPSDLRAMIPESEDPAPAGTPAIVSATEPTELVVSDGKPEWISLEGGQLLYAKNTETPWLRDLAGGNMYVQLSGRWFRARSETGPWTFVRADKLPASFQSIPPASDIGGVRTSVAGTPEAEDAVADAQVPQTAAIKRSEAKLTVEYDGSPKFERIDGTDVAYAVNTGAQVLRIDGVYYAVDNGVWFTSKAATGPWAVADSIPDDKIAEIPPSSPAYNTTYVTVYDSTPDVVYVGYTPGYLWSFPYYGVPVYGTGWYYPPYWGRYYYPRPPTWGFHVGYNPWTGWNFGVSWGGPFFRVGITWGGGWGAAPYRPWGCCGGWYGGGYRHNDININTGDINIGNNVNIGNRRNEFENRPRDRSRDNLYKTQGNRDRLADPATAKANLKKARTNTERPNNLYADRDGQVARRNNDDWEVRKDKSWQQAADRERVEQAKQTRDVERPSTRDVERPSSRDIDRAASSRDFDRSRAQQRPQIDRSQMNRQHSARQRSSGGMRRRR